MTPTTKIKTQELAASFAAEHVACRVDLQTGQEFPLDIWHKMGKAGLFKIAIAEIHGGTGGGYLDLLKAGEAFVKNGYNPGLAVSWLYQQIISHYVIGLFGTPGQQRQYLRAAAEGKITLSFAVSEPGRGAHPKMLTTQARQRDGSYFLNGEKTYLTNGPIAGVFIVIAKTGETQEKKSFTAFIVPRQNPGVTVMPPLALNFLKPSLHGGLQLQDCPIGQKSVLGKEGRAWPDIVVPLGEIEDVVMMGPALGGMAAQLTLLISAVRNVSDPADRTLQGELGALHALLQTLRIIAYEAARRLDRGGVSPIPLVIAFAGIAADFQNNLVRITTGRSLAASATFASLQQDMESLVTIKKRLMQIRQEKIGGALLKVPA